MNIGEKWMSQSLQNAVTKYQRLASLNRSHLSHSKGQKTEIRVQGQQGSNESLLTGLQTGNFLSHPHTP